MSETSCASFRIDGTVVRTEQAACFGLTQMWANRISAFPSEGATQRFKWLNAQAANACMFQKDYEALIKATASGMVFSDDRSRSLHIAKTGMAVAGLLVDIDTKNQISLAGLGRYPAECTNGTFSAPKKWYFAKEADEIAANTMYFWDMAVHPVDGSDGGLHACVSNHQEAMSSTSSFQFFDPNAGEFSVPCDQWTNFIKYWALKYAEQKDGVFIDRVTLVPIRVAQPTPSDEIPLIYATWNAGFFRRKSKESEAAMEQLTALAANSATANELNQAIVWYAGRLKDDQEGSLLKLYGTPPAQKSTLVTLLVERFSSHSFFNA